MRRIWKGLSIATAVLVLGGATPRAIADTDSTDVDDKQEQQIRSKLQKAPALKNNHIEVDVDDGIAVLEGTVDSKREKTAATQLAHVDGILGVNNRLEVRAAGK
jgi:osmotically-inducible protein OsmY